MYTSSASEGVVLPVVDSVRLHNPTYNKRILCSILVFQDCINNMMGTVKDLKKSLSEKDVSNFSIIV